jgi:hypothetical protein|tara:strand:- start:171 stop:551 length:381 start_codon:yes stop_codon:yes gene_type:complete
MTNSYPTDDKDNRVRSVVYKLIGTEDPDDLMIELMQVLGDTVTPVPDVGKYYIFVYNPKTSGIQYDQNPLVAVTDVFRWGFRGINFHWNGYRQYTWNEVAGQLYEVRSDELADVRELPFAKILLNS